jgi:hypothetical protein
MKHLRNGLIQKTYKFIKICSDEYWRLIAFNYSMITDKARYAEIVELSKQQEAKYK